MYNREKAREFRIILTLNMEEGNFGVSTYIFKNVSVRQLY